MHVAVIGASGATGRQVVQSALDRNWTVTALVRNPDSVKDIVHENLKVGEELRSSFCILMANSDRSKYPTYTTLPV